MNIFKKRPVDKPKTPGITTMPTMSDSPMAEQPPSPEIISFADKAWDIYSMLRNTKASGTIWLSDKIAAEPYVPEKYHPSFEGWDYILKMSSVSRIYLIGSINTECALIPSRQWYCWVTDPYEVKDLCVGSWKKEFPNIENALNNCGIDTHDFVTCIHVDEDEKTGWFSIPLVFPYELHDHKGAILDRINKLIRDA